MNPQTIPVQAAESAEVLSSEELLPLVYDELRKLAASKLNREKPGQTIQPTDLVHLALIRLVAPPGQQSWNSAGHFFAAAAEAMRRILINRAREKQRLKRGGGRQRVDIDRVEVAYETPAAELIELDEALDRLAQDEPLCAKLVKLHFFAGLTLEQAAESLNVSSRTADRLWAYSRAWLYEHLRRAGGSRVE